MSDAAGSCGRARNWRAQWADGELRAEQVAWLERHWEECDVCRSERDRFSVVDQRLQSCGEEFWPVDRASRQRALFLARIDEEERKRWRLFRPIPATVALLAVAMVLMLWWQRPRPQTPAADLSGFVAVPYIAPIAPYERSTVVSMQIPVANLLAAGFSITTDPSSMAQVDLLLGEDGRVHAVRLASNGILKGIGD